MQLLAPTFFPKHNNCLALTGQHCTCQLTYHLTRNAKLSTGNKSQEAEAFE